VAEQGACGRSDRGDRRRTAAHPARPGGTL